MRDLSCVSKFWDCPDADRLLDWQPLGNQGHCLRLGLRVSDHWVRRVLEDHEDNRDGGGRLFESVAPRIRRHDCDGFCCRRASVELATGFIPMVSPDG